MRAAAGAVVVVFGYGTVVHIGQVAGLGAPAGPLPAWLSAFFASLVLLDPLVAVPVTRRLRAGVVLGAVVLSAVVLAADAMANAWASYVLDAAGVVTAGRVGQGIVTVLAVALLTVVPTLWRWSEGRGTAGRRPVG
ncbi:hypothetical protein [Modestobacter sp. DSM 44400]|uniref:hypothetical protein n=1 Tax=Modestobacter sp. DSM 44400 TaxID=1550230 RepID=UPI0020C8E658|nr:hypothetical protein [Modestobacter sp. DSM 44400]